MRLAGTELKTGTWVVSNCAELPSEENCQLVIMGPADQRDDLLDAAVVHAVRAHHHEESPELRVELDKLLKETTF